jgi:uncharacterized protein (TIGR01777 family)
MIFSSKRKNDEQQGLPMANEDRKVLLSGASGLIGATLVRTLRARRISVFQLIRKKSEQSGEGEILWDTSADHPVADASDLRRLEGIEAAIHLSGANLSSHRWTESYKREIVASRVESTRALTRLFQALREPPKTLLCASATGIYGDRGDEILRESSAPGTGFLADTCVAWEAAADTAKSVGARVVHLRFGVVLAAKGGALKQMLPIFKLGAGGRLGSGRQWMSWIALPDLARAVLHLMEVETVAGAVNVVAPEPVTNAEFTHALGRSVHRPAVVPAPAFALRLAFGEMADAALLASSRAVPERLLESGFRFEAPEIDAALSAVLVG